MRAGSSARQGVQSLPDLRPIAKFGRKYLDLEVEGLERLPRSGMTVLVANHGGWLAFDGVMVAALIYERYGPGRFPVGFVEDILLRLPVLGPFAKRLGVVGISDFNRYSELAKRHEVFGIFPEGTEGNCKPLSEAYRLQEFRRGFVRLALGLRAQVVPVTIVGSDETFPVLYKWRSPKSLIGSIVPVPMSVLPIPVRWKVVFHEPIDYSRYEQDLISNSAFCRARAEDVRGIIQKQLDLEVLNRGSFPLALSGTKVGQWLHRAASHVEHYAQPVEPGEAASRPPIVTSDGLRSASFTTRRPHFESLSEAARAEMSREFADAASHLFVPRRAAPELSAYR